MRGSARSKVCRNNFNFTNSFDFITYGINTIHALRQPNEIICLLETARKKETKNF